MTDIYENFEIGGFWINISNWDGEHVYITGDISDARLIDEKLPGDTTLEEAKRVAGERVAALLAKWQADLEKPNGGWSSEWPTEVGHYWVYGYPWGEPHNDAKPRLRTGEVYKSAESTTFVVGGNILLKSEVAGRILVKPISTELPEFEETKPAV